MPFKFPSSSSGSEAPLAPQPGSKVQEAKVATPVPAPDRFATFMPFIFEWEGGFDNDPNDPGGTTWFGIDVASHRSEHEFWELATRRNLPNGKRNEEVWDQAREIARRIYRREYWDKNHCEELPFPVGEVVMNIAVNCGSGRAARWLQERVGAKPDGAVGPKTVEATIAHGDPTDLARVLVARTEEHYMTRSATLRQHYLKGWLNRNNALKSFLSL